MTQRFCEWTERARLHGTRSECGEIPFTWRLLTGCTETAAKKTNRLITATGTNNSAAANGAANEWTEKTVKSTMTLPGRPAGP